MKKMVDRPFEYVADRTAGTLSDRMIYRWGPRIRLFFLVIRIWVKRQWWGLTRILRFGWQGRLVEFRERSREIEQSNAEMNGPPWKRPSFSNYPTDEDREYAKALKEAGSLRNSEGEMTLGRLVGELIEKKVIE